LLKPALNHDKTSTQRELPYYPKAVHLHDGNIALRGFPLAQPERPYASLAGFRFWEKRNAFFPRRHYQGGNELGSA